MHITPFHSERGCLSYLLVDPQTREAALIDPSEEVATERYLEALAKEGATLRYLIETHTHADHISSTPALAKKTGAKIVRHTAAPSPQKDIAVTGGEVLSLGKETITVLATPGHTNESISLRTGDAVFTGDALLIGGTGRTDFQLGDSEALYNTLHEALGALPDETIVHPGHDYQGRDRSTLGTERATNPRFTLPRDVFVDTMEAHHPPQPELFEQSIATNSK